MRSIVWTRDEVLVAFNLYCRTPFGRLHARNPEIVRVASKLGRTASALAMKCCNLAALDATMRKRGVRGLRAASSTDRKVWAEFEREPERIAAESEQAWARVLNREPRMDDAAEWESAQGVDREQLTRVRVNQHLFRSIIMAGYGAACAVCDLPLPQLLVASHIVGWAVDQANRMNPTNGICLCTLHDRAYDTGLLLILEDYRIGLPRRVKRFAGEQAVHDCLLKYEGLSIRLPDRWAPDPQFLRRHAELLGQSA